MVLGTDIATDVPLSPPIMSSGSPLVTDAPVSGDGFFGQNVGSGNVTGIAMLPSLSNPAIDKLANPKASQYFEPDMFAVSDSGGLYSVQDSIMASSDWDEWHNLRCRLRPARLRR